MLLTNITLPGRIKRKFHYLGIFGCSGNISNLRTKEFMDCSGVAHRPERRIPETGHRMVKNLDSSRALVGSLFSEATVRVSQCQPFLGFGSVDTRLKFQEGKSLSG